MFQAFGIVGSSSITVLGSRRHRVSIKVSIVSKCGCFLKTSGCVASSCAFLKGLYNNLVLWSRACNVFKDLECVKCFCWFCFSFKVIGFVGLGASLS